MLIEVTIHDIVEDKSGRSYALVTGKSFNPITGVIKDCSEGQRRCMFCSHRGKWSCDLSRISSGSCLDRDGLFYLKVTYYSGTPEYLANKPDPGELLQVDGRYYLIKWNRKAKECTSCDLADTCVSSGFCYLKLNTVAVRVFGKDRTKRYILLERNRGQLKEKEDVAI